MKKENITVVDHPLVQHKLTLMREKETSSAVFRQLLREISTLLTYEVLRDIPLTTKQINTPIQPMDAPVLSGKKLAFISILRAGNGLLDGMLDLVPSARVGHVGLYRDHKTLEPVEYYFKVPKGNRSEIGNCRGSHVGDSEFCNCRDYTAQESWRQKHQICIPVVRT